MKASEIKVTYHSKPLDFPKVNCSRDVYEIFLSHWDLNTIDFCEEFKIAIFNRSFQVLGVYHLSKGGIASTMVDPKIVFSIALKCNSSMIALCHNHPSGNLKPSEQDKRITEKIINGAKLLDIEIADHLIISKSNYLSFKDDCLM